ncbi:hypothetical protein IAQ61_008117 [Plenodomus lingam]|uniref:uncharacterized protein n=1 Tax=Leptosphaeria maculans TaxID=5022 RepID=UPI00331B2415|nr:hypothetical protein IAQ61_008117 [Plenodomus lingam]
MLGRFGGGRSAVYALDGRRLTKSLPPDEEGFVYVGMLMDLLNPMRNIRWIQLDIIVCQINLWLDINTRNNESVKTDGKYEKEGHGY